MPTVLPELVADKPQSKRMQEVLKKALDAGEGRIIAWIWAYRPFELPVNVFDFTVSRHRDGPDDLLRGASGLLMADCWSLLTIDSTAFRNDLDVSAYVKDVIDQLLSERRIVITLEVSHKMLRHHSGRTSSKEAKAPTGLPPDN